MNCPYCGKGAELIRTGWGPKWSCEPCDAYVGCHRGTTRPLGTLAKAPLRKARIEVHRLLDALWRSGKMRRGEAYKKLSKALGTTCVHVGEMDLETAARAISLLEAGL